MSPRVDWVFPQRKEMEEHLASCGLVRCDECGEYKLTLDLLDAGEVIRILRGRIEEHNALKPGTCEGLNGEASVDPPDLAPDGA